MWNPKIDSFVTFFKILPFHISFPDTQSILSVEGNSVKKAPPARGFGAQQGPGACMHIHGIRGEPDGPSLPVSESLKPRLTLKLKLDKNK